jgi:hypothetical protein
MNVASVHTLLDEVERAAKHAFPRIVRLVGHAEPAGAGHGLSPSG